MSFRTENPLPLGAWLIHFYVKGSPKAQPRPRATAFGGRARIYSPSTANKWKELIALEALENRPVKPFEGPIRVTASFVFKRPLSHFFKRVSGLVKRPDVPYWHTSKPDRDNLEKALLDTLTNCKFWKDDCQVVTGEINKIYANEKFSEGCYVTVEEL
tara:strand:- start:1104 stop:1577 length:474 start_codon:yes stop_codon:yes gene_type:complete